MKFIFQAAFIVCIFVLMCETRRSPYGTKFLTELCGRTDIPTCIATAMQCIVIPHIVKTSSPSEIQIKYCRHFKSCLDQAPSTRKMYNIYITDVTSGRDRCADLINRNNTVALTKNQTKENKTNSTTPNPSKHWIHGITFEKYLTIAGEKNAVADFECCMAKASGKFNADESVNVASWKQDAARITDSSLNQAIVTSIDSCAASEDSCSVIDFEQCIVANCYNKVKSHLP